MASPQYNDVGSFLSHKFTHLIIGGGTAGLCVAARLSENPNLIVGILEAGPAAFDEQRINVPGRFGETLGTEYDWQFETTPQDGLSGRTLAWPRGRVLGGTSALNFMAWNRGCKEDYDTWQELGNEGWGWDQLLPFFKKSEHFHNPDADHQNLHQSHHDAAFHGTDGPLHTVYALEYGASHQHWHATLNELGVKTNRSHMSGSNVGCWTSLGAVNPEKQERSYSATAYYRPNAERANLVLLTKAVVREVISEKAEGEWAAKGVIFVHGGKVHVVKTEGEVVVCAGSVQSPNLLELSGIGNPDVLKRAGIDVKVDNPNVGEHLQDHMMTAMVYEIDPSIITNDDIHADPALAEAADLKYATSQSGIRTVIPSSYCYLPFSHYSHPSGDQTTTQYLHSVSERVASQLTKSAVALTARQRVLIRRFSSEKPHLGQMEFCLDVNNYSPHFKSVPGKKYMTMLQMLQYPFSTGSTHTPPMKNNKPTTSDDKPIIDPKYYAGPGGKLDELMMATAQKFADKICSTKPLSDITVSRVWPPPSTSKAGEGGEDFTDWVRNYTITDWHPVGTCGMGGKEGKDGGVVDERLRVYGVRRLRVVDASVMPVQISAHLQATVYAIGEKGASMIVEDWENTPMNTIH